MGSGTLDWFSANQRAQLNMHVFGLRAKILHQSFNRDSNLEIQTSMLSSVFTHVRLPNILVTTYSWCVHVLYVWVYDSHHDFIVKGSES